MVAGLSILCNDLPIWRRPCPINSMPYQPKTNWLKKLLDLEGPFDAVLGFTIGAAVAATLLVDNISRSRVYEFPTLLDPL